MVYRVGWFLSLYYLSVAVKSINRPVRKPIFWVKWSVRASVTPEPALSFTLCGASYQPSHHHTSNSAHSQACYNTHSRGPGATGATGASCTSNNRNHHCNVTACVLTGVEATPGDFYELFILVWSSVTGSGYSIVTASPPPPVSSYTNTKHYSV